MNKAALDAMQMALSAPKLSNAHEGAPACSECGMLMVPNGACYKCEKLRQHERMQLRRKGEMRPQTR